MARNLYVVSMALGRKGKDIETWPGPGSTYIRNKAIVMVKELQKEIDTGKWDERKRDGYTLRACIEELDPRTLDLISVIEI
ncbi:MAG: hypothetical protein K6G10_02715 [Butyrivibrio sp.]|nr:hypothetical protein [Butyrivibrio sp.]